MLWTQLYSRIVVRLGSMYTLYCSPCRVFVRLPCGISRLNGILISRQYVLHFCRLIVKRITYWSVRSSHCRLNRSELWFTFGTHASTSIHGFDFNSSRTPTPWGRDFSVGIDMRHSNSIFRALLSSFYPFPNVPISIVVYPGSLCSTGGTNECTRCSILRLVYDTF
jgi:hypothetical protein